MGRGEGVEADGGAVLAPRSTPLSRALIGGVRTAGPESAPALAQFKAEMVDSCYVEFAGPALEEWKSRFCAPEYFAERISSTEQPTQFFYCGEPEEPMAMGALKVRDGAAYLGDLYARERGQGLGKKLLQQMYLEARRQHLRRAVCDVFSTNTPALEWMRREGFEIESSYTEQSLGIEVYRLARALS